MSLVKLIEPPCTERYARWCERSAVNDRLLLDSTPREPAEIDCGIVKNKDGTSVDAQFRKGAELALDIVIKNQVELVILQSRSPSCGVNTIYDGSFTGKIIPGQGVFAELLKKNNIKAIDVADIR